jgi:methyl-accepting chemotaxis protein
MSSNSFEIYTTDLYELIRHTQTVIRTQKNSGKMMNTKALDLLHVMDLAFTDQINGFEEMDTLNDGTKKTVKNNTAKAAGKIAGFIDAARDDAASKMLRDDYTALSMIASGYTMLHTAALGKGNDELADFAQESLARIAQLITETSKVIPHIAAEAMDISEIADEAEKNTQEAWDPESLPV